MNSRIRIYKGICLVLVAYGVLALVAAGASSGGSGLPASRFLLFALTHAFLVVMAGLRFLRPQRSGTPGSLLLTLAVGLVVVGGAVTISGAPAWLPVGRLVFLGAAYLGLRLAAPVPESR